jgi:hypothetical protein
MWAALSDCTFTACRSSRSLFLISVVLPLCVAGGLAVPAVPPLPGMETFPGAAFHTARWDHSVDLNGKRVAVVGTGEQEQRDRMHV